MTLHYNQTSQREKRRALRNNATEAERRLWWRLQGKQLGVKFRRQYSVDGFVVDFYSPSLRNGRLTADELLQCYCAIVHAQTGSYEETALQLDLDPRTVRAKVSAWRQRAGPRE